MVFQLFSIGHRVSVLAYFGHKGYLVCFLHSSGRDMGMLFRRSHFFIIIEMKITKPFKNYVYGNLTLV